MHKSKFLALAAMAASTGCIGMLMHKSPHTPDANKGDVAVVIANNSADPVCDFAMVEKGANQYENWLGTEKLAPGATQMFHVRAAIYGAAFVNCDQQHGAVVKTLMVNKATYLSIGANPGQAPAAYAVMRLPQILIPQGGVGGGGEVAEAPAEEASSSEPAAASSSSSSASSSDQPQRNAPNCTKSGQRTGFSTDCCSLSYHPNVERSGMVCD